MNLTNLSLSAALMATAPLRADGTVSIQTEVVTEKKVPNIIEIKSIKEISHVQPDRTLVLLDLDDTLFDFPYMLGSQAWRRYIVAATKRLDNGNNWHDRLSYLLAQKHPLQTVELMTNEWVHGMQENHAVGGLTARERNRWYETDEAGIDLLTTQQLLSVKVDFNKGSLESNYPSFTQDSGYFRGTFFVDTDSKGEYILRLFQNRADRPKKVIFVDDKQTQVESVAKALAELGIEHECYYYTAISEKAKTFNPLLANIQLYVFIQSHGEKFLSDKEAAEIAKQNVSKNADNYLREALDLLTSGI